MRSRGMLAGVLAGLLAAGCGGDEGTVDPPPPPPTPTGTVVGRITVEGLPLPGVLVSLSGTLNQSAATGADGSYRFVSVPLGSHVVALASGIPGDVIFSRTTAQVTLSAEGQEARADFPGEYLRTSSIRGRVLAVSQGSRAEPVEGIALRMTGLQDAADTTDASGRYEFVALRAGEYTVSLLNTGGFAFDATSFTRTVSSGQQLERDFIGAAELFIVTESLDIGRVAIPYSQQLVARGGTTEGLVWSLAGGTRLPEGLIFTSNGTITGTPGSVGVAELGFSVTNAEGRRASATLTLRVCEGALGLDEGDYQVFTADERGECGFFVQAPRTGAYYRVTMVGTETPARPRVYDVELGVEGSFGTPSTAVAASEGREAPRARQEATTVGGPWLDELLQRERDHASAHARIRRAEAELVERLRAEGPLATLPDRSQQVARAARGGAAAGAAPAEYDFRLNGDAASCAVDTTVTARLVAENEYLAFYEYQTSVSPSHVRLILDYYADHGEEVIRRYFGGISDVNGDGLVNVLIHPGLEGNTRAYVWSADLTLAASSCAASNEMELIHIDAGTINDIGSNDYWVLGTIVHEMKHVSSLYKRFQRSTSGTPFHPLWIEEGTADIAKEVSSRLAWEREGGPGFSDRVTGRALSSIIRSGRGAARQAAFGAFVTMARTVWAFAPDSSAVTFDYGGGQVGDIYGSGWHFHRFLRDWVVGTGAGADERFVRELNDSLTAPGVEGIVAVTGRPMDELLIEHAIAMTFAGSESVVGADVPHFTTYDFPTATEVFNQPDPPGFYPWPVTTTGEDTGDTLAPVSLPLATMEPRTFAGRLGASGIRVHDFRARAVGNAAAFYFDIPASARIIVARIRNPNP